MELVDYMKLRLKDFLTIVHIWLWGSEVVINTSGKLIRYKHLKTYPLS